MKVVIRIFSLFIMLFGLTSVSRAEVRIVIDEVMDSARPIAVVPFKWNGPGSAPADIAKIISDDLRNSGKFNPMEVSKMPQQPTSAAEVNSEVWSAQGIEAVIVGQVTPSNGGFDIAYQLVDTMGSAGSILSQNQYTVTQKWLRYGAHTVSDESFEKLTGIKGAFRTRIAYVVQKNGGSQPYEVRVSDYDGFNQFIEAPNRLCLQHGLQMVKN